MQSQSVLVLITGLMNMPRVMHLLSSLQKNPSGWLLNILRVLSLSAVLWPALSWSGTPQTITFTSTAPTSAGEGGRYNATTSSTGSTSVAVVLTTSDSAVCSISNTTITFNAVGTCTVNANKAAYGAYDAAPQVQQTITVNARVSVVTNSSHTDSTNRAIWTVGIPITPYNRYDLVTGGNGVYRYFTMSGRLPPGLTLNAATGEVSGTPTARDFSIDAAVAVNVEDSTGSSPLVGQAIHYNVADAAGPLVLSTNRSQVKVGTDLATSVAGLRGSGAVSYASFDTGTATVNAATGVITGVRAGQTYITVTQADDGVYPVASSTVLVNVVAVNMPMIDAIAPNVGPTAGGTVVTLSGSGFAAGALPTVGTAPMTNITVTSTSITATIPANTVISPLTQDIRVYPSGTVSGNFGTTYSQLNSAFTYQAEAQAALTATATLYSLRVSETSTISVTGGSGAGSVTYASSNTSIATVDSSTGVVTALTPGSVTITATKAATAIYSATSASQTLTVSLSNNANLSNLSTTGVTTSTPTFSSGTTTYTQAVANTTSTTRVTPTSSQVNATIQVNGVAVASRATSGSISLAVGLNTITVVVTAQDSSTKTYTLLVTREATAANLSVLSSYTNGTAPTTAAYSNAGVTGVTSSNLAGINSVLAALPTASRNTTVLLQRIVDAYNAVQTAADGNPANAAPTLTAAQFAALGLTGIDTTPEVNLLNDVIGGLPSTAVDSQTELAALASVVERVIATAANSVASPALSAAELTSLGLTGVSSSNLSNVLAAITATANDGSGADTVAELQTLVTQAINAYQAAAAVSTLSAYTPGGTAPSTTNFSDAGVTGVTSSNLAEINSVLAALPTASRNTTVLLQRIVDAYNAVQTAALGNVSTPATLTAAQLATLGFSGLSSAPAVALFNSMLAGQTANNVATYDQLAALAATVQGLMDTAAGGNANPALTPAAFAALGITGVNINNLALVLAAIEATANDGSGVNSLARLQTLVNTVVSDQALAAAVAVLSNFTSGSAGAAPTVADFAAAGVSGVTSAYLSMINRLLTSLPASQRDSLAELQQIVRTAQTAYTGQTATGAGAATTRLQGGGASCKFAPEGVGGHESAFYIPKVGHPKSPAQTPPGTVAVPFGLVDFVLTDCTVGASVTMTIEFPAALPTGAGYFKYGINSNSPTTAVWYQIPATISGNTVTFSLTDGGMGDADGVANGVIVDPGGVFVPQVVSEPAAIPTLGEWALLVLAGLMGLLGCMGAGAAQNRRWV